jgi:hypothetical protein
MADAGRAVIKEGTASKWRKSGWLARLARRGPCHHHPDREGAGRARAEGAATGAVRLAFNPVSRDQAPREKVAAALDWAQRASLPVAALQDTATVRLALTACARNLDGKPAAGSTQRRKQSVFYNALSSRPGRTASATSRPTTCARARVAYVWWQRPQLSRTVAGHKNLLGKLGSDPVP